MQKGDYLKDYYKSLEEAPYDVLEECEGTVLAALEDYQSIGDENEVIRVRDLMNKKG